jgi:hypothetical protein
MIFSVDTAVISMFLIFADRETEEHHVVVVEFLYGYRLLRVEALRGEDAVVLFTEKALARA